MAGARVFAGDGEALAPAGDGWALGILADQLFEGSGGFGPALLAEEAFRLLGQGLIGRLASFRGVLAGQILEDGGRLFIHLRGGAGRRP